MKIKTKLVLWYTLIIAVVLAAVLVFIMSAGGEILFASAENLLRSSTQKMAGEVEWEDGELEIGDDFMFSINGAQMLVYSGGALAAGQLPRRFSAG